MSGHGGVGGYGARGGGGHFLTSGHSARRSTNARSRMAPGRRREAMPTHTSHWEARPSPCPHAAARKGSPVHVTPLGGRRRRGMRHDDHGHRDREAGQRLSRLRDAQSRPRQGVEGGGTPILNLRCHDPLSPIRRARPSSSTCPTPQTHSCSLCSTSRPPRRRRTPASPTRTAPSARCAGTESLDRCAIASRVRPERHGCHSRLPAGGP